MNHPKKVKTAWAMYDWANSVYSLVITTAIFPIFYNALTSERNGGRNRQRRRDVFWGRVHQYPTLQLRPRGQLHRGDHRLSPPQRDGGCVRKKLQLMKIFCYTGSLACMSMHFFDAATWNGAC